MVSIVMPRLCCLSALVARAPIIWGMSTPMKIASFFVMGGVFLGLGFVYTRYRDSLKKLL